MIESGFLKVTNRLNLAKTHTHTHIPLTRHTKKHQTGHTQLNPQLVSNCDRVKMVKLNCVSYIILTSAAILCLVYVLTN